MLAVPYRVVGSPVGADAQLALSLFPAKMGLDLRG